MQLNPYLSFSGQCEAAFKFYEQRLGGKIVSMFTHAGTPMEQHVPKEWLGKVMHASMNIGGTILMGSDAPPDRYEQPKGFGVMLAIKDPAEAQRAFAALAENGKIGMPIQKTFWAELFGTVTDQFGIPWMINCEPNAPIS